MTKLCKYCGSKINKIESREQPVSHARIYKYFCDYCDKIETETVTREWMVLMAMQRARRNG